MNQIYRVSYGNEAPPGRFKCSDCGYEVSFPARRPLPPCPRFDDAHSKRSWKFLHSREDSLPSPESGYPVYLRKKMAIRLALMIAAEMLARDCAIRVESFAPSRSLEEIHGQLESLSSGALIRVISRDGPQEYFDMMYKCQWPVSVVEHSAGMHETVSVCINRMSIGEPRQEIHTAVNSLPASIRPAKSSSLA